MIATNGARILGTHVKFFRDGDAYTLPAEGTAGRGSAPADEDDRWIDVGAVLDAGLELEREEKEVWAAPEGQGRIMLHDVIQTKRGLMRSFSTQELSPLVIEVLYGTAALDELSEDFFALAGRTKKGWMLIKHYDQSNVLLITEKVYVHLQIVGEVKLNSDIAVARFESRQLISATGYPILTEAGLQLLSESDVPILTES